jgi:hypothetical protein
MFLAARSEFFALSAKLMLRTGLFPPIDAKENGEQHGENDWQEYQSGQHGSSSGYE